MLNQQEPYMRILGVALRLVFSDSSDDCEHHYHLNKHWPEVQYNSLYNRLSGVRGSKAVDKLYKNIARIANAVHCHSQLSGNKGCQEFGFSIVGIANSVSNVTSLQDCLASQL